VRRVLIDRRTVVKGVRRIVDVVDGDVHRGRVDVTGVAAAVIADGVGEAVTAEVVGRGRVSDATGCKRDGAVGALGDSNDCQTGIERRRQIVRIGVVGQHVDGIVRRVLIDCRAVVKVVRRIVDVVDGDVHRGRVDVTGVAAAVIADGVGEAVAAEVSWGGRVVGDAGCYR